MELTSRKVEAVLNLIGSLTGTAWKLVEDFNLDDASKDTAFKDLLKKLDAAFQYDSRVQLPNDFDNYFNLNRSPGQTLLEYVTLHDELYRKVGEHNVTLPNTVQGWHMLRRSNLTKDQRQLVLTQAPGLEKVKIQEALFLLFGQDYRAGLSSMDRRWKGKSKGKGRGYVVADDADSSPWHGDDGGDFEEGYYETEFFDASEFDTEHYDDFDTEAIYYQEEPHDPEMSQEDLHYNIEEYDEAFAAYVDARRRFNDIKLSRGFLPVVALTDPQAGNVTPGLGSGSSSPTGAGKGKKGTKGAKGKGRGKSTFSGRARPAGKGDIRRPQQCWNQCQHLSSLWWLWTSRC